MLVTVHIDEKTIGAKPLYRGLDLTIQAGEKLAIIGRNGVGKTTLFNILAGEDGDFKGDVQFRRGTSVIMTAQEHTANLDVSCLDCILASLPEYSQLHHIIETYPEAMGDDMDKIHHYSETLERFGELGYYDIEKQVIGLLGTYQIDEAKARGSLRHLSGGQKRFVELVKVQRAGADLALIDEPTNHMDYVAKDAFIGWLRSTPGTVVVISHDRDVLKVVDRIIEMKDQKTVNFTGNYDAYLKQNSVSTVTQIGQYEVAQRTIDNVKKQIQYAISKKSSWGGTADKKNPFVVMEERLRRELKELESVEKPSFWIDQDSVDQLDYKMTERYDRYKDKNIKLGNLSAKHSYHELISVKQVSIGYDQPLFDGLSFTLAPNQRLQLRGRNGAGKTTLIGAIRAALGDKKSAATIYSGEIEVAPKIILGIYEQEVEERFFQYTLGAGVMEVFRDKDVPVNDQAIRQVLAQYLFDPVLDYKLPIERLSGGQRARFQIISMLANKPNLLILDEPTNHLDLPSIEEIEKALTGYAGAILYVSHDSYFTEKIGGEVVQIGEK